MNPLLIFPAQILSHITDNRVIFNLLLSSPETQRAIQTNVVTLKVTRIPSNIENFKNLIKISIKISTKRENTFLENQIYNSTPIASTLTTLSTSTSTTTTNTFTTSTTTTTALGDITRLFALKKLQYLSLDLKFLKNLSLIENLESFFPKLKVLEFISCSHVIDIESVSSWSQLQTLKLNWCTVLADVKPVGKLNDLRNLIIKGSESLYDISALHTLCNLQSLDLHYCCLLMDISVFSAFPLLKKLNLADCTSIMDFSPISY
eukprot:Awhi_evm1s3357